MKRILILGVLILAGCAPAAPTSTQEITSTEPPTQTQPPSATAPTTAMPLLVKDSPDLVPVTGPSMEVGSEYPYVDGSVLMAVPGGEFAMGANGPDNPEHSVTLSDFWIYSTKVTNQQYALCVNLGQCTPPELTNNPVFEEIEHANDPVVGVTFDQAAAYCSFVNGRLPTEAEWEKAARGPDGSIYPWGDADPTCDLLNYYSCMTGTSNVVNYPLGASYYGALDMAGNAFEWVADWYDPDYYADLQQQDPTGPDDGARRSVRSGGYKSGPEDAAGATRHSEDPKINRSDLGFRCAVDDPLYFAPFCEAPLVYGQTVSASSEEVLATEVCPAVSIEQYPACAKKLSTTDVALIGPEDATRDPSGCGPTGDPSVFTCAGAGQVSISASCQVDIPGDPACPPGYSLDGSKCQANSAQGSCLPGMEFDSGQGCCTPGAESNSIAVSPVCPVGSFYVAGENVCTPNPVRGIVSVVQSIQLKSCDGGGAPSGGGSTEGGGAPGGGEPPPPACQAPAGGCEYGSWDDQLCCCADGGDCY